MVLLWSTLLLAMVVTTEGQIVFPEKPIESPKPNESPNTDGCTASNGQPGICYELRSNEFKECSFFPSTDTANPDVEQHLTNNLCLKTGKQIYFCCPNNTEGCAFSNTNHPDKAILEDSCLEIQCNNNSWEFTGTIKDGCQNCSVYKDPHVWTFDIHSIGDFTGQHYYFQREGDFVLTRQGLEKSSLFGVNVRFVACDTAQPNGIPCIKEITYYEPGIRVKAIVTDLYATDAFTHCTQPAIDPVTDSKCEIKVFVNNEKKVIGKSGEFSFGTNGNVLILNHKYKYPTYAYCVIIVGSKGLTVSLCQYQWDFAWIHVYPSASLKGDSSQLYGLCDTFTGTTRKNYTLIGGSAITVTTDEDVFERSWEL